MTTTEFTLTETQRQIVHAPPGKLVFLAGPGAGKTVVIGERAVRLIVDVIASADHVLLLAPTRRSALALGRYVRGRLGAGLVPTTTSFHGLALNILRRYHHAAGYRRPPQVLNDARLFHEMGRLLDEDPALWPRHGPALASHTLQTMAYYIVRGATENGLDPADVLRRARTWARPDLEELASFYARYRQRSREAGCVDFGELLAATVELLATRPDVADECRRAYPHILVDEFEQAGYAQAEILHHLAGPDTDLLVTGDPQQAISGYRGGSAAYLLASPQRLGAQLVVSSDNLRSSGPLASLVRSLSPDVSDRTASGPENQDSVNPSAPLCLCGERSPSPPRDHASEVSPSYVVICSFTHPHEEAVWLAAKVQSLATAGVSPTQIAILFRGLSTPLARLIAAELARRGIRSHLDSSRVALAHPLMRATVDLLRYLAAAPDGDKAFERFLKSSLSGLPPFGQLALRRALPIRRRDGSATGGGQPANPADSPRRGAMNRAPLRGLAELFETAIDPDDLPLGQHLRTAVATLADRLARLKQHIYDGAASLLWETWRLFPAFNADALADGAASAAYAALLDVVSALEAQRGPLSLPELLEWLDLDYFDHTPASTAPQRREDEPGVTITTVHQARGQDWEIVFLPDLVEGRFPRQPSPFADIGTALARDVDPYQPSDPAPSLSHHGLVETRDLASLPRGHSPTALTPPPAPDNPGAAPDLHVFSRARHLAEERRVFYVAVSRARRGIYLSHSRRGADGNGTQLPSRFLDTVSELPGVETIAGDADRHMPTDVDGAILHYRRRLASTDPLLQAQALYALHHIQQIWPEAVQPAQWWGNIRETEGAAPPFPDGRLSLSASRLTSYRNCPLAYQFSYHWGLSEPVGPPLTIGSLLHRVLEEYHRPGAALPRARETLEALLDQHFVAGDFRYRPIARQARKSLLEMLNKYFDRYGQSSEVTEVEKLFRFRLGPHTINGRIDRIDRLASGYVELIDYKTGSQMSKSEAQDDLQLALYDLAFYHDRNLQALGRPDAVSYLYPRDIGPQAPGKRSYAPTDETRARLQSRIAQYTAAILDERFPSRSSLAEALPGLDPAELDRALRGDPCRYCAFVWICPEQEPEQGKGGGRQ